MRISVRLALLDLQTSAKDERNVKGSYSVGAPLLEKTYPEQVSDNRRMLRSEQILQRMLILVGLSPDEFLDMRPKVDELRSQKGLAFVLGKLGQSVSNRR